LYIDESLTKDIDDRDLASRSGSDLVAMLPDAKLCGMRQNLRISAADFEIARTLNVPLNAPIARIHRTRYDTSGRKVVISTGVYRGDVVNLDFAGGVLPKQKLARP